MCDLWHHQGITCGSTDDDVDANMATQKVTSGSTNADMVTQNVIGCSMDDDVASDVMLIWHR